MGTPLNYLYVKSCFRTKGDCSNVYKRNGIFENTWLLLLSDPFNVHNYWVSDSYPHPIPKKKKKKNIEFS